MPKPEGGVPYFCQASSGYYRCLECGVDIFPGDFIQGPKHGTRGMKARWHYDCEDPQGSALREIAQKDLVEAPSSPKPKRFTHGFRRKS